MLPRGSRLRASEDFDQVFRQGKPFFLGEVLMLILPTNESAPQVGIAFKGKSFPKASLRHVYKRKMLAALQPHLERLPRNTRVVLLFQKTFPNVTFAQFEKKSEELFSALSKAKKTV